MRLQKHIPYNYRIITAENDSILPDSLSFLRITSRCENICNNLFVAVPLYHLSNLLKKAKRPERTQWFVPGVRFKCDIEEREEIYPLSPIVPLVTLYGKTVRRFGASVPEYSQQVIFPFSGGMMFLSGSKARFEAST